MRKKAILIVAALLLVVSGVAAVSAYEGHLVNIKAHVENAIGVETYELDFGVSFPQEQRQEDLTWGLSESFLDDTQDRVSSLTYDLYWELKTLEEGAAPPYLDDYYVPLNPFLHVYFLSPDGDTIDDAAALTVPGVGTPVKFGTGYLAKADVTDDDCDTLHFTFYVPVFEGYFNDLTNDPYDYMLMEGEFITEVERICDTFDVDVPHADLGIDLKIQVTGFGYE